jgi:hypothetical protein
VVEGLKEGQQVVASGAYGLPDNTKITVEAPKESAKQTDKKPKKGRENDSEK